MRELVVIVGIPKSILPSVKQAFQVVAPTPLNSDTDIHYVQGLQKPPLYTLAHIEFIFSDVVKKIESYASPPEKLRMIYLSCYSANLLKQNFFLTCDMRELAHYFTYSSDNQNDSVPIATQIDFLIRAGIQIQKPGRRTFRVLPPQNYLVDSRNLYDLFLACFLNRTIDESTFGQALKTEADGYDKTIYKDRRGCLYKPCKPTEQHGDIPEKATQQHILTGMYRFGWLYGKGFHHDVRHHRNATLANYTFECSLDGHASCKSSTEYVNIYLNDFVRGDVTFEK
jgi:hypothetical protein